MNADLVAVHFDVEQHAYWLTRSSVVNKDGSPKRVRMSSASSFGKMVGNRDNLINWRVRTALAGIVSDDGLRAEVTAAINDGADKRDVNKLAERCVEVGGGKRAANLGTLLHAATESSDKGEREAIDALDEDTRARVDVWVSGLMAHGIEVRDIEQCVFDPALAICATLDRTSAIGAERLMMLPDDDGLTVVEIKTGKRSNLTGFPLSVAMQLAVQARCPLSTRLVPNPERDGWLIGSEFVDRGAVNLKRGLVVSLPAEGEVGIEVFAVDIEQGWALVEMALAVRAAESAPRKLLWPWSPPQSQAAESLSIPHAPISAEVTAPASAVGAVTEFDDNGEAKTMADYRQWLQGRLDEVKAAGPEAIGLLIRLLSEAEIPTLKQSSAHTVDDLRRMDHLIQCVEDAHVMPFPERSPVAAPLVEIPRAERPPRQVIKRDDLDDGSAIDASSVAAMAKRMGELDERRKTLARILVQEAAHHGWPIYINEERADGSRNVDAKCCERRFEILRAVAMCAEQFESSTLIRAALVMVLGDDAVQPVFVTGALLGSMSIDEAKSLHEIAVGYGAGRFDLRCADDESGDGDRLALAG